jgi:hypothetical protein
VSLGVGGEGVLPCTMEVFAECGLESPTSMRGGAGGLGTGMGRTIMGGEAGWGDGASGWMSGGGIMGAKGSVALTVCLLSSNSMVGRGEGAGEGGGGLRGGGERRGAAGAGGGGVTGMATGAGGGARGCSWGEVQVEVVSKGGWVWQKFLWLFGCGGGGGSVDVRGWGGI